MIALDASVLIAHLQPNDAHHAAATRLLSRAVGEGYVVHSMTLAEVLVGAVLAGRGEEMLGDLVAIGVCVLDRDDGESLRLANLRATTGLKLPDCCVLLAAEIVGGAVATFDDRLAEAARALGFRVHRA